MQEDFQARQNQMSQSAAAAALLDVTVPLDEKDILSYELTVDDLLPAAVQCFSELDLIAENFPRILARLEVFDFGRRDILTLFEQVGETLRQNGLYYQSLELFKRLIPQLSQLVNNKQPFIRSVIQISRIEFMRGISSHDTLELQMKGIDLINEANATADDGLLLLYAGAEMHLLGDARKGFIIRKRGIDILSLFDYENIRDEVMTLLGWHYYHIGDFSKTISTYEMLRLSIENYQNKTVNIFGYLPILYSYLFIDEHNKALVLGEILLQNASEAKDTHSVALLESVIGRIYLHMDNIETGQKLVYRAYGESIQSDYGWGQYYALFGICLLHYKNKNLAGCRDALETSLNCAHKYNFYNILASPFILDVLRDIESGGFEPIPGLQYRESLEKLLLSPNSHMAGAACRHEALMQKETAAPDDTVLKLLLQSVALLKNTGCGEQLALSYIELALLYLNLGNTAEAAMAAENALDILPDRSRDLFPNALLNLTNRKKDNVDIKVLLDINYLEFIHIINGKQLSARLMTSLGRMLKAECSAFVKLNPDLSNEILVSQNINRDAANSLQYERICQAINHVVQDMSPYQKHIVQAVENNKFALDQPPVFELAIPFIHNKQICAILYVESHYRKQAVSQEECDTLIDFAGKIAPHIQAVIGTASNNAGKIEPDKEGRFDQEVYHSAALSIQLLEQNIAKVSGHLVPVLLTGETGVGKEVFARMIYNQSSFRKVFIKVNCGAIPESLIESELFGYEKGSFTGASTRKIGYFEAADKGTIFLDEIGELSLSAQVKLLRVLQEHEFIRVGGVEPIQVTFRLIAATNKDLSAEVKAGHFRQDLFYRLNVIQLRIPALRNRKEDIPGLARYFAARFCEQLGLPQLSLSDDDIRRLMDYHWPGNVRELENIIEKSVLLSPADNFSIIMPELLANVELVQEFSYKTLAEVEADYIKKVLAHCRGKIAGEDGAAAILGLKRTTLLYRMEKLGIK